MWKLNHKENWAPKNWCFPTAVWQKTPDTPLDSKEIKPVNPKYILEGLMLKLKLQYFCPSDTKSWHNGKDPDARKDWSQYEKGTTDDKMVGWHHWLSGCKFEQALGDGEGQGSLVCCSPWSRKELDTIEQLNNKTCQNIDLCIYLSWLSWFSIVAPELLTGMGGLSLVAAWGLL